MSDKREEDNNKWECIMVGAIVVVVILAVVFVAYNNSQARITQLKYLEMQLETPCGGVQ